MEIARGERHLLAAILLRAIKDMVTFSQSTDQSRRVVATEAQRWLFEEDEEEHHLTSFHNICRLMDLDTEKVRRQVRRLQATAYPAFDERQVRGAE